MLRLLPLALLLAAGSASAQATEAETAAANAVIAPMLQEMAPGRPGQVIAACVLATAEPAELATLAAAPGPSTEMGAVVTAIVARPAAVACIEANLAG